MWPPALSGLTCLRWPQSGVHCKLPFSGRGSQIRGCTVLDPLGKALSSAGGKPRNAVTPISSCGKNACIAMLGGKLCRRLFETFHVSLIRPRSLVYRFVKGTATSFSSDSSVSVACGSGDLADIEFCITPILL